MTSEWQPIETAPKDGTCIWVWLNHTGIRKVFWLSATTACERFGEAGDNPEDFIGSWSQADDISEDWSPQWWLPLDAITDPEYGGLRSSQPLNGSENELLPPSALSQQTDISRGNAVNVQDVRRPVTQAVGEGVLALDLLAIIHDGRYRDGIAMARALLAQYNISRKSSPSEDYCKNFNEVKTSSKKE